MQGDSEEISGFHKVLGEEEVGRRVVLQGEKIVVEGILGGDGHAIDSFQRVEGIVELLPRATSCVHIESAVRGNRRDLRTICDTTAGGRGSRVVRMASWGSPKRGPAIMEQIIRSAAAKGSFGAVDVGGDIELGKTSHIKTGLRHSVRPSGSRHRPCFCCENGEAKDKVRQDKTLHGDARAMSSSESAAEGKIRRPEEKVLGSQRTTEERDLGLLAERDTGKTLAMHDEQRDRADQNVKQL